MKKTLPGLLIFAITLIPSLLMGFQIKEIAAAKSIFLPPSIAENGKSFVYTGLDEKTKGPAIFVSCLKSDGTFSTPSAVVTVNSKIEGTSEKFNFFLPLCGKSSSAGFNSPIIQDNIVTFGASLKNLKKGVFYAIKENGKWKIFQIAIQGQTAPGTNGLKFGNFDAPYITTNSEAIFITSLNNETNVVYAYKIIPGADTSKNKFSILCKSDRTKSNFFDISVAAGEFAIPAESTERIAGKTFMYIFDRKTGKLIKTVPEKYGQLPKGEKMLSRGPSYFGGRIAYTAYTLENNLHRLIYAIYTNAGGNVFSQPFVITGKYYDTINTVFTKVWNPTLYIKDNKAYITFIGHTISDSKIMGVYVAIVENGKVTIKAIAVPGQKLSDGRVIQTAAIGAVSIRNGIVPMALTLEKDENIIAVAKIF